MCKIQISHVFHCVQILATHSYGNLLCKCVLATAYMTFNQNCDYNGRARDSLFDHQCSSMNRQTSRDMGTPDRKHTEMQKVKSRQEKAKEHIHIKTEGKCVFSTNVYISQAGGAVQCGVPSSPVSLQRYFRSLSQFVRNCYRSDSVIRNAMFNQSKYTHNDKPNNSTNHVSFVHVQICTAFKRLIRFYRDVTFCHLL